MSVDVCNQKNHTRNEGFDKVRRKNGSRQVTDEQSAENAHCCPEQNFGESDLFPRKNRRRLVDRQLGSKDWRPPAGWAAKKASAMATCLFMLGFPESSFAKELQLDTRNPVRLSPKTLFFKV
jgi:hypothetical protein